MKRRAAAPRPGPAAPLPARRRGSFLRAAVDPDCAVADHVAHFAVAAVEHFAGLELDAAAALAHGDADACVAAARGWTGVVDHFAVDPHGVAAAGALDV